MDLPPCLSVLHMPAHQNFALCSIRVFLSANNTILGVVGATGCVCDRTSTEGVLVEVEEGGAWSEFSGWA